ncbi:integrase catalytic domain-containing protein [Trichonephila clavipes]|nr:integrase catalytic domain-containing protein [Trichonephila clavipes]
MASLTRLKRLTVLHFTYGALIQVDKSLLGSCAPNQSIVLAWIKKPLAQLKTFVRNRVSIIQELTESDFWKLVNSENNPADILSRGISPDKIQHCELWWFGPTFLHQYKELEPYDITAVEGDDLFLQELKETSFFHLCALLKNFEPLDIISNCSSFTKLQRVIAWCAEATLANIRNSFWIPSARNVVRKILRTCITYRKVSAKVSQQLMADLPAARVTACRVFSQLGIDYCGPFQLKTFSGKCRQIRKVYVCVFICFTVKAIHLELVSYLTTEAFLAALKRFVARRERPIEIHSDKGWNFVGANNELRKILKALFKGKMEEIMDILYKEQIKWNFNPPSAPHFGGLWEAGVKSLKHHLKRVIGNSILSHEEFLTLVVQSEAVLNSRPICPLSNDPNDVETLTPAQFLVGSSLVADRLSRWQLVQKMIQHFWRKWSSEYLNRLQQRPKWCKGNVGFKEGDLVLVKPSENSDSLKWHLARILKLHPGEDNIVRVVTLKGKQGIYKRPITKIANLP